MKKTINLQISHSLSGLDKTERLQELNKRSTKIIASLHTRLYNNIQQALDFQIFVDLLGKKHEKISKNTN